MGTWPGTLTGNTDGAAAPLFRADGAGPGAMYTLDDVYIWNGYVLSQGEIIALLQRQQDPTTIGTGAAARFRWTLAGNARLNRSSR